MIGQIKRGQASRYSKRMFISTITCTFAMLVVGQVASAQYTSDFEKGLYAGSAEGTIITGQDGFYIPVADSQNGMVYTYTDNILGIPQNPNGGSQFAGVTGGDIGLPQPFARAQRDIVYGNGTGTWTASFDIAITFNGNLPTAQNIGSFSTQVFPNEATFIALATWTDPATAANWNADYVWFDAAGTQLIESVNDPGFQNLQVNHWYRWSTTFDLDTNLITEVALTDLTTNTTVTNNPVGKYLWGGSAGAPSPTGFRLFAGSNTVEGNTLGFDNVDISSPVNCPWDLDGSGIVGTTDLLDLLSQWGTAGSADFDGDGNVGTSDLLALLANWGPCP